ncbi:type II secretion system protein N [Hahella sp. SMD15-11]|uniref:Type II secretion system protein N n=1 Tax=Thermohahella caldifontis TaxID=3142973 RepID=A0AB39V141_9GAMM
MVALISLLIGLIWTVPAGLIWKQAMPIVRQHMQVPVTIRGVAGTLPRGQVMIQARSLPVILDWRLRPTGLSGRGALLELIARTSNGQIESNVSIEGLSTPVLEAKGNISLESFNYLLSRYRLRLAGELDIHELHLTLNPDTGLPMDARGLMVWSGGPVQYPAGSQLQTADMPPLRGRISGQGGDVRLEVSTQDNQPVMRIRIDGLGTAHISVLKRLVDLAGAPWPNQVSPDTEVFKLRQRLM